MRKNSETEQGLGLIEVSIALLIFMVALLTLAQALTFSIALNKKSREILIANTLCKDKVEQLLSLDFDDSLSNTAEALMGTKPLVYKNNGSGLSDGGLIAPTAPATTPPNNLYVDYINIYGERVTAANLATENNIIFTRQWQISTNGNYKTIEVTVVGPSSFGLITQASMVAYKTRTR